MENKGQGIFYGVIGVATLVVAIIGATFAYFSASASVNGNTITGGTNDNLGGALSLEITRMTNTHFGVSAATSGDGLVPTNIDGTAATMGPALTAGCIDDGYTGCHVYKLEATSSAAIDHAYLRIDSMTIALSDNASTSASDWKVVGYTTANDAVTGTPTPITGSLQSMNYTPATDEGVDLNNGAAFTANQTKVFYIMVYLANDASNSQNSGGTEDARGTYTGSVSFKGAGGGKVVATFGS